MKYTRDPKTFIKFSTLSAHGSGLLNILVYDTTKNDAEKMHPGKQKKGNLA